MPCIRVHFAKTQVQLRLDQHSSIPRVYGITLPLPFSVPLDQLGSEVRLGCVLSR